MHGPAQGGVPLFSNVCIQHAAEGGLIMNRRDPPEPLELAHSQVKFCSLVTKEKAGHQHKAAAEELGWKSKEFSIHFLSTFNTCLAIYTNSKTWTPWAESSRPAEDITLQPPQTLQLCSCLNMACYHQRSHQDFVFNVRVEM